MLQIRSLTMTHKTDLRVLLEDFSLALQPGDKAVIIGEEGNGKSTLLRWIYDPALTDDYIETTGERLIARERLGYLPQELTAIDSTKTIYTYFSEQERFWERSPKELAALAGRFGLSLDTFYSDQLLGTLSGGEKIKIQFMRLLLDEPTVLLLDEPSNDIDISTLELLEELIRDWPGIVLFISHDETLIEHTANMVIHVEQIKRKTKARVTVARLSYQQYIEERLRRFARQERQAVSDRLEKKKRDERYHRIEQSVTYQLAHMAKADRDGPGRLMKKKMKTVKSLEKRFAKEDEQMTEFPEQEEAIFFKLGAEGAALPMGKTVVEFSLPKLYAPDGGRLLAKDIFLRLRGPAHICIVGKNGCGKSTLIRRLAEELLPRADLHAAYMPQNYEDSLPVDLTPVEYLAVTGDRQEETRIRTYLGALKYTADEMSHPVSQLSGGQKAKVLLLKMSLSGANVLILDEPTRNFSPLSGPVIRRMIREFPGAVISISHDRKFIDECCETVYELTYDGLLLLG